MQHSQAEQSLVEIALWTHNSFGEVQAQKYEAELIERCEAIASGVTFVQNCGILVGQPESSKLFLARSGQHFIVFEEQEDLIVILEFFHSRSDLPAKIASLKSQDFHPENKT
jgi:toxin ParE1/3/4